MEESEEELRAKVTASTSSSSKPNSNQKNMSIHNKVDGEISSVEADEVPTSSAPQFTSETPSPVEPIVLNRNKITQISGTDKRVAVNGPASSSENRLKTSGQQSCNKHPEMDLFSPQSGNQQIPSWYLPPVPDDNLVICFSDDESESDYEDYKSESTSDEKTSTGVQRKGTLISPEHVKPKTLQRAENNQLKMMEKKLPFGRAFMSPTSKTLRASSRSPVTSLVRQVSRIRNTDLLNKTLPSQVRYSQGVSMNNIELQILRQQIAIREKQLKLQKETIEQNCKHNLGRYQENNDAEFKQQTGRQRVRASGESAEDEQAKKRLKHENPNHVRLSSDVQQPMLRPTTDSISKSKTLQPQNNGLNVGNGEARNQLSKGCHAGTNTIADKQQLEVEKSVSLLPKHPPIGGKYCKSSASLVETASCGVQNFELPSKQNSGSLPVARIIADVSHCEGTRLIDSSMVLNKNAEVREMNCRSDDGTASPPKMPSQEKPAFAVDTKILSCLGRHNPLDDSMDSKTLTAMVELQDKELEEAQEHRHRCEVEERNALKAYRNAQRDLLEANSRCRLLYQRRDALSTRFQASIAQYSNEKEEVFFHDNAGFRTKLLYERGENLEEGEIGTKDESESKCAADDVQDYSLTEASLRSKLFARLGSTIAVKSSDSHLIVKGTDNNIIGCIVKNKISQKDVDNQALMGIEQNLISDGEGTEGPGKMICELPVQVNSQQGYTHSSAHQPHRGVNPENDTVLSDDCRSTDILSCLPSPALRTVVNHVKSTPPVSSIGLWTRTQPKNVCEVSNNDWGFSSYGLIDSMGSFLRGEPTGDFDMQKMGSAKHHLSVDPFWPLCMFELRGRCNDEKCRWQHVKDFRRIVKHRDESRRADFKARTSSNIGKITGECKLSQFLHRSVMPAPTAYTVGSNVLGADSRTSGSLLARNIGQYWLNLSGNSLRVDFSARNNLLPDVPFLHVSDGLIKGQGSRKKKSSYLKSRDGLAKQLGQGLADAEKSVDLAIVLFKQEVNKVQGRKKALSVLARALESDPASVVLWVVYLHIYYRTENAIGNDDMFLHAIQNNEDSYKLWIMYINSRVLVDDRLAAYDAAILALCRCTSACDEGRVHVSSCILDLFLQMMDFLCMSGDFRTAIKRIYGLLPTAEGVSNSNSFSLSNILSCLTVSDKGIFWVCCVYLVIYRKLPDPVVHQFDFQKGLPSQMEWPSVLLTANVKHQALKLMEVGVDAVASDINSDLNERENALKSAHFLAISHVQCVGVFKGLESSKKLLNKYISLYPTCLELVITSARLNNNYGSYEGFEDALRNWPNEVPGIQCIWNQYAQYALENGEVNLAELLMDRWSQSYSTLPFPQTGNSNPSYKSKDELFRLLNLSLHKLLQKDDVEARTMMDKALKLASSEDFKHCVREHALLVLSNVSNPMEDSPTTGMLGILDTYLFDCRFSPVSEPLSRKFCKNIKMARTRQLMNNMLGSVSCDCSLLNTVLEAWCGPSLLPEKIGELKDLVNHVEAIMGSFPANYLFALSVCRLIISHCKNSGSVSSDSIIFWAISLLVNSIYHAIPLAPEKIWVEVCAILTNVGELHGISKRFHEQALSVYPFSIKLWKSYLNLSKLTGKEGVVIDAAGKRGIKLE